MNGADWVIVAVVVVLFVFSIFLALSETAFVRMSRIRALALAEEGNKRAERLAVMLEQPEQTLNSVLLLVLVSQLTTATLIGVLLEGAAGGWGVVIGILLQIVLFFVIGEVAPKTFAVQHTERAALSVTPLLWFLTQFAPLRWLSKLLIGVANVVLPGKGLKTGPFVTEEEIRTMADVAASEDVIEREEQALIHSIFEFGDTVVREVMQPSPDVLTVDCDQTIEEGISAAIERGYSRIPCRDGDDIIGLVYLKDMVRRARDGEGDQSLRTAVRPATFVPEQKRVAELLREMQTEHFHMAVVIDEYGATSGIVTMEDLLEEIVGEIADEYDVERPGVERLDDGSLRVPGRMSIDDVSDELGTELPDTEWDTVGGLILNLLGHVPEDGESVQFKNLEFTAEDVQERRIGTVHICVVPENADAEGLERNGSPAERAPRMSDSLDMSESFVQPEGPFRSGFVSLVGRPNVGKSTLVNRLVGQKVAIVSDRPQTTRTQIRGVRTTPTSQLVLLDTPGIHKPRTLLGERTNDRARSTLAEVDVVCLLIEATSDIGAGDKFVGRLVQQVDTPKILVVSKTDLVSVAAVGEHLSAAVAELGEFDAYVPLSSKTGDGIDGLLGELEARLPEGPEYYPGGVVSDQPETFLVAELVREKLLRIAREELPHSITVVAEELEPERDDDVLRYDVKVLVERESQKGMVIGKGGEVIREAGTLARKELEALLGAHVHLETKVKVERDWQRRAHSLDRLGY